MFVLREPSHRDSALAEKAAEDDFSAEEEEEEEEDSESESEDGMNFF